MPLEHITPEQKADKVTQLESSDTLKGRAEKTLYDIAVDTLKNKHDAKIIALKYGGDKKETSLMDTQVDAVLFAQHILLIQNQLGPTFTDNMLYLNDVPASQIVSLAEELRKASTTVKNEMVGLYHLTDEKQRNLLATMSTPDTKQTEQFFVQQRIEANELQDVTLEEQTAWAEYHHMIRADLIKYIPKDRLDSDQINDIARSLLSWYANKVQQRVVKQNNGMSNESLQEGDQRMNQTQVRELLAQGPFRAPLDVTGISMKDFFKTLGNAPDELPAGVEDKTTVSLSPEALMHPASLEQLFVKFDPTKQTIVRKNESKPFTHTEKIKEVSAGISEFTKFFSSVRKETISEKNMAKLDSFVSKAAEAINKGVTIFKQVFDKLLEAFDKTELGPWFREEMGKKSRFAKMLEVREMSETKISANELQVIQKGYATLGIENELNSPLFENLNTKEIENRFTDTVLAPGSDNKYGILEDTTSSLSASDKAALLKPISVDYQKEFPEGSSPKMIDLAVLNMLKATTDQKNVLTKYRTYLALDPNAKQNKITELFDQFFSKKEAQRTLNKWEFGTNPNETFSRCMITTLLFGDGKAKGIKEVASTSPTKENPEKDYITPVECKENGNGTFVLEHTPQNTPIRYKIGDDQEAVFIEYPNRPVQIPDLPKPLIITLGQKKADGSMDEQFQKSLDIGLQGVAYTKTSTEDRDTLTFAGLDTTKYYNLKIEYTEPSKTDIKTFEENNFLGTKTTYEISGTAKKVELQEKGAKAWKVIG